MASKIWPAFMLEPAYQRELDDHETLLRDEWDEAQEAAARDRAHSFEEGSPA